MTTLYWAAAAVALVSAIEAALELARDRSPVLAAWTLSMMAMSASLAVAAAAPTVMRDGSGPATSVCASLGVVGTWAFAEALATRASDARRIVDVVTTPLLGGASAPLLLLGLRWASSHGTSDARFSSLATVMVGLTLMAYYVPGLCRVAILAHQRARSIPAGWTRNAMRVVSASACAELVLFMARSAVLVAQACGLGNGGSAIPAISVLQGLAMICGVGGLAAGPVIMAISTRCGSWLESQS